MEQTVQQVSHKCIFTVVIFRLDSDILHLNLTGTSVIVLSSLKPTKDLVLRQACFALYVYAGVDLRQSPASHGRRTRGAGFQYR